MEGYSVGYEVPPGDIAFTLILNRVLEAGLMHGATDPELVGSKPIHGRLWHFAFDDIRDEAARHWYASLGTDDGRAAGDPAGEKALMLHGARRAPVLVCAG